MSLAVRPADLRADAGQIVKLLTAHVNPRYDHLRFDWLYRQNPDGPARAWLSFDTETGEAVGTAAAIPRRIQLGNRDHLVWVLSDFCVAGGYRALGPALQLQRACLAPVASEEVPFCYDFPSAAMMAVYNRLRIPPFGYMQRLAYPLRVNHKVQALPLPSVLRRGLSATGNVLLNLRAQRRRPAGQLEFSLLSGRCGPEFSGLATLYGADHHFCIQRTADYLNWRFLDNPFQRYEILTALDHGRLVAYAVLTPDHDHPAIVDLFGPVQPDGAAAVAIAAVALARERGAAALSVILLDSHPWLPALVERGFRPRDTRPVIVYTSRAQQSADHLLPPREPWLLTEGDRDA